MELINYFPYQGIISKKLGGGVLDFLVGTTKNYHFFCRRPLLRDIHVIHLMNNRWSNNFRTTWGGNLWKKTRKILKLVFFLGQVFVFFFFLVKFFFSFFFLHRYRFFFLVESVFSFFFTFLVFFYKFPPLYLVGTYKWMYVIFHVI